MIRHGINTYKRVWACWPTFPIHRRRKNINKFHCKQQYYFIKNSYPTNRNDHKQLNVHFVEIILACSFKSSRSYFSFSTQILIQRYNGRFQVCWRKKQQNPKFKKSKLYAVAKPFISGLWFVCSSSAVAFSN
jgi:hypothetical protein